VNFLRAPFAAVSLLIFLSACSGANSGSALPTVGSPTNTGKSVKQPKDTLGGVANLLDILLCDAPPSIGNLTPTEIDLGVTSVAVVSNGTVMTIATYPTPNVVNVLAAQTDPSSIGIGQYFNGTYQQLQFTFDVASSKVVANGTNYPITFLTGDSQLSSAGAGSSTTTTGSATSVTVTVSGNFSIQGWPAATVQADFNALESLALSPSGSIVSRPTLFAVAGSQAGMISGSVTNSSGGAVSGAVVAAVDQNGNVANTVSTDSTGAFQLHTVAAGQYNLVIYNSYTTATGEVLTASGNGSTASSVTGPSVTVTGQQTTQVGSITD